MGVKIDSRNKDAPAASLRVLIVDDHEAMRRSMRRLLSSIDGIQVCGEAVDGPDAIEKARQLQPDVITMDVSMPGMSGLEATREIRRFLPGAKILVVTLHNSPEIITQAQKAGANGYVLKSNMATELVEGLEPLRGGQPFVNQAAFTEPDEDVNVDLILQRNAAFQQALSQSAKKLRETLEDHLAITNNMAEGLYTVDAQGLLASMNPAAERMLGWSKEELLGKKMHDVTHHSRPDGTPFPASECPGLHVLRSGIPLREHEDVFIRKDGSYMPVVYNASPLKRDGDTRGVVVAFRDDTEHRRFRDEMRKTRRELERANSQFRLVASGMSVGVARCSRDFRYLWANERYSEWIQRPLGEIIGKPMVDVLGVSAFEALRPRFEQVLTGAQVCYERETGSVVNGPRWTAATYTPTFDSTGIADGWIAVVQDITERKRTEIALRESERKLMSNTETLADLNQLSGRLIQIRNVEEAYQEILLGAIRLMRAKKGNMQLLDRASGALKIVAQSGFEQPFLTFFETVRADHPSTSGAAFRRRERVIVEDITQSSIFAGQPSLQVLLDAGVRAVQSTPLVTSSGTYLGMISTHFDVPHQPLERELQFMDLWARHAADYLERANADESLNRYQVELEEKIEERTKELSEANRELSTFSVRLMQAQDEERRRFARELHDTAGQTLAVMSMLEDRLARSLTGGEPSAPQELEQLRALTTQLGREIRTTSYLLHPPLLDEAGLRGALGWLLDGFTARSDMKAHLKIPEDLGRLPNEIEMAIFRLVQEALTNVHRYSSCTRCSVHVERRGMNLFVSILDNGKGITPEKLNEVRSGKAGVGIRGIRERVNQLQGTFEINSDSSGTKISVTLPLALAIPKAIPKARVRSAS